MGKLGYPGDVSFPASSGESLWGLEEKTQSRRHALKIMHKSLSTETFDNTH